MRNIWTTLILILGTATVCSAGGIQVDNQNGVVILPSGEKIGNGNVTTNTIAPISGTSIRFAGNGSQAILTTNPNDPVNSLEFNIGASTATLQGYLAAALRSVGYSTTVEVKDQINIRSSNGVYLQAIDDPYGTSTGIRPMRGTSTNSSAAINLAPMGDGSGRYTVATDTSLTLSVLTTMRGTAGTNAGKTASFRLYGTAKNIAGTVTIVDQTAINIADDSGGAFTAGFGVSGTTFNVTTAADAASTVTSRALVEGVSAP